MAVIPIPNCSFNFSSISSSPPEIYLEKKREREREGRENGM